MAVCICREKIPEARTQMQALHSSKQHHCRQEPDDWPEPRPAPRGITGLNPTAGSIDIGADFGGSSELGAYFGGTTKYLHAVRIEGGNAEDTHVTLNPYSYIAKAL